MNNTYEVEAKFEIGPGGRELLLSTPAIGRFAVLERTIADQDDTYYDTDSEALAAAGSTLRVRRTAKAVRMTFKGRSTKAGGDAEAHLVTRLEDEVALDADVAALIRLGEPLPDLAGVSPLERARAIVGAASLRPVARLENTRATIVLGDADTTIEMAVDDCTGTRFSDGRVMRFEEVELEARAADRAALMEASMALRELVPGLTPSGETKLGRTLN